MVNKILILLLMLIAVATPALAWPPSNIRLTYDLVKGSLHVVADHPSDRLDRYYLHKMVVTVNGGNPTIFYYTHQVDAWGFTTDEAIAAKPGDHLTVQLWSIEGGEKSQDMTIPTAQSASKASS